MGNGRDQPEQELSGDDSGGLLMQFHEGALRGTIDGDELVLLALMRDRRLQRIEAVILRQQRIASKGDDDGLFIDREQGRPRLLRPNRQIEDTDSTLQLRDGLLVDSIALRQRPQAPRCLQPGRSDE